MAAVAQTIGQLNDMECNQIMNLLIPLDKNIIKKVNFVENQYGLNFKEALEYVITNNPVLWAKVYLDWEARDYQDAIITEGKKSKKLVLRLGRRLGKSDSMCVLILWFAYTQYNRGPNNQYDIIIATPYETQIDLIFKRLHQLIEVSPVLKSLITRDVHHNIHITVGGITSNILGLTAGANNSSGGGNSTRGQRADLLILDECDYIGSNQITNILNIRNEAPERIRLICASTPSGKHEEYYRWCINASKRYYPTKDDIENNKFSGYEIKEKEIGEGNGWTEIYAPSNVNKELLKINPDTQQTYLEDIKDELSDMRYTQEVMAEFGEEEMGVYQKRFIEAAVAEGDRLKYRYITKWSKEDRKSYLSRTHGQNIRILGVDWDKYSAATNMVCMELDRFHQDQEGRIVPLFKMLFRIEVPRSDFTYVNAMNKIVELNEEYKFDWIGIDRGYGKSAIAFFIKICYYLPEVITYERKYMVA